MASQHLTRLLYGVYYTRVAYGRAEHNAVHLVDWSNGTNPYEKQYHFAIKCKQQKYMLVLLLRFGLAL